MSRTTKKVPFARPPGVGATAAVLGGADNALLDELILLLSNLEYLRVQMADQRERGRPAEVVRALTLLMDEAVGTAERLPADEADDGADLLVLAEVGNFYTAAQEARQALGGSSLRSLFNLFRAAHDPEEPAAPAARVGAQFLEVFRAVLGLFDGRFSDPGAAAEWAQARDVFFADLTRTLGPQGG